MEQRENARRLTTVLATDVVAYSKMTARNEEHAIRLVRQRFATASIFIEQHDGRVFNTAGDALLAEFASPVEAVRCAIEIQEAMRTANELAPEDNRLQLRIGINLGDVMVSGTDLLGDGVNVAARLEGLAPAGGICVSSSVYEQLIGKLTLGAEDLGEQQVKNIPRPIRAYRLTPQGAPPAPPPAAPAPRRLKARVVVPVLGALVVLAAAAVIAVRWLSPMPPATAGAATPPPVQAVAGAPAQPPAKRVLVPEAIPFIDDRAQERIRSIYLPGLASKALAISSFGHFAWASQRFDEATARKEALDACNAALKRATPNPPPSANCAIYAIENDVVWTFRPPPMPPRPWIAASRPTPPVKLDPDTIPLVSAGIRQVTASTYVPAAPFKAMAIGRDGTTIHAWGRASDFSAMRAALESCGFIAQRPCFVYALGDEVVVHIPKIARIVDVLTFDDLGGVSQSDRQRIATTYLPDADWRALAIGRNGRIGLGLRQTGEQHAIDQAMRACEQAGGIECTLAAIGPFKVAAR
ncbi:MAG: adenylate/guanylate cyclase domain-containing protein [Reyranella sp.]|nr:adenylate/guanylate cyclase domain-containing protein [Reyranella sp.]MBL6652201.1 adenylate/guanylate cyclase domain-containing protein [Reyranella sp.]